MKRGSEDEAPEPLLSSRTRLQLSIYQPGDVQTYSVSTVVLVGTAPPNAQ
jgi:hypothetical protein